jgi:AcrR family transcriptional regulator
VSRAAKAAGAGKSAAGGADDPHAPPARGRRKPEPREPGRRKPEARKPGRRKSQSREQEPQKPGSGKPGRGGASGVSRRSGYVSAVQRVRVLGAASEIVERGGYEELIPARVIARAGVSSRTFYDLFVDREDCFLALFDEALEEARAIVVPAYESERRPREQLRMALAALLDLLDREPATAKVLIVEALRAGARVARRREEVSAELTDAIHRLGMRARDSEDGEPLPLTDEGIVNAVFGVIHARVGRPDVGRSDADARIGRSDSRPLGELLGPLMAMIVLPYVGARAAGKELSAPGSRVRLGSEAEVRIPAKAMPKLLKDPSVRITERTLCVIMAIAEANGRGTLPSNGDVGWAAGDIDKGQISKALRRVERLGLIENVSTNGGGQGGTNAWRLTAAGDALARTLGSHGRTRA